MCLRREIGLVAIAYVRRDVNAQANHMHTSDAPLPRPNTMKACGGGQSVNGHQRRDIIPSLIAKDYVSRHDREGAYTVDSNITNFDSAVEAIFELGDEDPTSELRQ